MVIINLIFDRMDLQILVQIMTLQMVVMGVCRVAVQVEMEVMEVEILIQAVIMI